MLCTTITEIPLNPIDFVDSSDKKIRKSPENIDSIKAENMFAM